MKNKLFIKLSLLLLLVIWNTHAWADTDTDRVVYCAISDATKGSYTLKVNANIGDNNTWRQYTMTVVSGKTFNGKKVYTATVSEKYGGVDALQFQLYSGDTWKGQKQPISSWTTFSSWAGKICEYEAGTDGIIYTYTPDTYYLEGNTSWISSGWTANNTSKMTDNGDYTWSKTVTSLAGNNTYHAMKIYGSYGSSGNIWRGVGDYVATTHPNIISTQGDDNFEFKPAMSTASVTVTYNALTGKFGVTCQAPTITFDKEGGSSGTSSQNTYYGEATSSIVAPSKDYHDFAGYWTGDDGTGTEVINSSGAWKKNIANYTNNDATALWIVTADHTLHAKWTPKTYKITYKDQGNVAYSGSNSASLPSSYTYGTGIASLTAGVKTGYTFGGWYTNSTCTDGPVTSISSSANGDKILYAKWTVNNHDIDYNAPSNGSYTIKVGSASAVSEDTNADYGTTIALAATANDGYHFGSWTVTGATPGSTTSASTNFSMPDNDVSVAASFAANTYTVTFNKNGGSGDAMSSESFTYGTSKNLTANTYTRTGYTFQGWATSAGGSKVYNDGAAGHLMVTANGATVELFAVWQANNYTVTLDIDEDNHGTIASKTTSQDVTYDGATTTVPALPTAANGYALDGYYTEQLGEGTKVINADGTWIASVTGYTDGSKNWVHDGDVTLYAYYKKAEITAISLSSAVLAPEASITATPTVSPTPTGTTIICWRVLYSNDNPLESQPTFTPAQGNVYNPALTNAVTFAAPSTSGMYKIEAVLRTGSACGGGTELCTIKQSFQVAGEHEVTVQYKDASGNVIKASGSVTGRPLAWSDDITAPDIFGYTFARWDAGDGVTIKNGDSDPVTTSASATIKIKAVYDGRLTAVYNKKSMIYFKNTLGWSNVYFHNSYWDNSQGGAGNKGQTRNQPMSLVPGETDIYYWEGTPGTHVAFTNATYGSGTSGEGGYQAFWAGGDGAAVVFPSNPACASSANTYYGYNAGTPMFVPITQEGQDFNIKDGGKAVYYNKGYWRYYDPVNGEEGATGYTLKIYNKTAADGREEISSTSFTNANVSGQLFKATVNLEAAGGYGVKILRNNSMLYTNASGHLQRTGDVVVTDRQDDNYAAIWIKATAAGDYDFIITCNGDGKICLQATFPAKAGDYRVLYTDNATWSQTSNHVAQTWNHPSRVISAEANAEDTISFYVAKGNTPQYKIEKITEIDEGTGAISWTQVQDWTDISVAKTGVYNFKITQNAAGNGISSVENLGEYTGNYYIRTDCAGSTKWDNYKSADHMMTYSEYSETYSDYTHYFMRFVTSGTNVKFTIANDYSACISDTIVTHSYRGGDASHVYTSDGVGHKTGDIKADANIRFMWDIHNNKLIRAYLARGKDDGSKFLVLRANSSDDMKDKDGNALINSANSGEAGYNHKAPDNCMQFVDNENWIYEANIKIKPGAFVKLSALFNGSTFYFKGSEGEFDASHAIQLMTGEGEAELVRVIYDFKTDRLVAAWQPSGNIATERAINADVMFVREHQGDIEQLTFTESGKITKITTAYAVLRFNKWTINNKSKEGAHAVLDPLLSRYERDLFYVSFPFRVSMNEVFGFGTYGQHWIIEEYDGAGRASKGFWADSESFWTFVTDRRGKFFEPNQGYIIALDLDELGESSSVWDNGVENVELYFPSYGTMGSITNSTVTYELDAHTCTIGPRFEGGDDRRIADSHWNVMSVPTYVNTNSVSFSNTTWTATRPSFLYVWNMDDNSLTPRSGTGYTYHAMHAYMVQYEGDVTWTSTSVTQSSIVARRAYAEAPSEVEFRLELSQNEKMADQTFVKLSNDEEVSAEFVFGEDMSKEFNKNKANIYTMVSTMIDGDLSITKTAGNTLPMINQTTIVPVGVKIAADGDYTFAIPEGTYGVGVTLIDNETGARTNLGLMDYTVNLSEGQIDNRFWLEISPIAQSPTGIDQSQMTNDQSQIKKVMIDGLLYIVKDGKVFDARGSRVK